MKLNLEELNPPTWFDVEGDKDGARVALRILNSEEFKKINKAITTTKKEFRDGKFVDNIDTNKSLENEMMFDYCIVDWENIFDAEDKPIPCNKEMKIALMERSIEFNNFVIKSITKLTEEQMSQEKVEEKNS